jgi:glycosyltransferase involved in cell wall biosynthesis
VSRRSVLIVAPFPPRLEAAHGGARVIGRLAFELALTNAVGVLCFQAPGEAPVDDALRGRLAFVEQIRLEPRRNAAARIRRGAEIVIGWIRGDPRLVTNFRSSVFRRRLRDVVTAWRPRIVHFEPHLLGQYAAEAQTAGAKTVVVVHEPGAHAAAAARALSSRVDAWAWRRFERRILPMMDAVVVLTNEDLGLLQGHPHHRTVRIPFGADAFELPEAPRGSAVVLYYANYSHAPNREAAERLAHAIFPRVRQDVPDARLVLAGDASAATLPTGPGVEHAGFVSDIASLLASATVVAAPIRTGGGMRVKVAESLAAGKAVVATHRAVAGMDVVAGEHYAAAETDAEFASSISRLLRDQAERRALELAAKEWAAASLRWEDVAGRYDALYASLDPGHRPNDGEE